MINLDFFPLYGVRIKKICQPHNCHFALFEIKLQRAGTSFCNKECNDLRNLNDLVDSTDIEKFSYNILKI